MEENIYRVDRDVISYACAVDLYGSGGDDEQGQTHKCGALPAKCALSRRCAKSALLKTVPLVSTIRNYKVNTDLLGDVIAGLTVGIMHIPQGMAYSMLAGLDPVYGLYTAFFPVLVYFIFGTSRHASPGSSSVTCLMVGATIDKLCGSGSGNAAQDPYNAPNASYFWLVEQGHTVNSTNYTGSHISCELSVATAVTFLVGIIQLALGLLRLGFVTVYLSKPMTRGWTTGAAVHVLTGQLKYVLGIPIIRRSGALKLMHMYIDIFSNIKSTHVGALCLSVICIIIMHLVKNYANPRVMKVIKAPIPIDLIIIIAVTTISHFMKLSDKYQFKIVGYVPKGFPTPRFPPSDMFADTVGDAAGIAVVTYVISMSLAQVFTRKYDYAVDSNQELIAMGASNIVASNFHCYTMSVSFSRSLVQASTGGKTQLASLIQSVLILIVILAAADLFYSLPNCVLSAIIIAALKGMLVQFKDIKTLWKSSKWDLSIWIVACLTVILTDIDIGLFVGVGWSFVTTVLRTQKPRHYLTANIPYTDLYTKAKGPGNIHTSNRVKIFSWESPIYFANSQMFVDELYKTVGCHPKNVLHEPPPGEPQTQEYHTEGPGGKRDRCEQIHNVDVKSDGMDSSSRLKTVVIDCASICYVDSMGVTSLNTVFKEYQVAAIKVLLAACNSSLVESLEAGDFFNSFKRTDLFPTVHDAVLASEQKHERCHEETPTRKDLDSDEFTRF